MPKTSQSVANLVDKSTNTPTELWITWG